MLGEWVLVGTGARRWGFDVIFFFGFFGCSLIFFYFFFCPFCILPVCLGAPFTLFNNILFITYQKKCLWSWFLSQTNCCETIREKYGNEEEEKQIKKLPRSVN